VKKAVSWINNFENTAAELAIESNYHTVICGHIHQPQKRIVRTEKGEVLYLNSGDWIENLTALEYNQQEWNIYQHPITHKKEPKAQSEIEELKLLKKPMLPDVIGEHIAAIIGSAALKL
jgi:hypothetical protein